MRRRWFGLPVAETNYVRRGFRGATEEMQTRLEQIGTVFLGGYHAVLEDDTQNGLVPALNSTDLELRGFAFEGAAMGLALLDFLTPWRRTRIREFLGGVGDAHAYMVHVGIGWLWARIPFGFRRRQKKLDPLYGWLALDGWGFHARIFSLAEIHCRPAGAQNSFRLRTARFRPGAWLARSGSSTAETPNSSRRRFHIFPPTGRAICGAE